MSEKLKTNLISAIHTFVPVFAVSFIGIISDALKGGSVEWTSAFWLSLAGAALTAGLRAGFKALWQQYAPMSFGGVAK